MKILTILKKKILILTGPYFLMPQPENRVSYTTSHTPFAFRSIEFVIGLNFNRAIHNRNLACVTKNTQQKSSTISGSATSPPALSEMV